jgi:tetratricopeptide (TPR) repeat protein
MYNLLRYRHCKDHLSRQIAISVTLRCVLLLTVCILVVIPPLQTLAQSKSVGTGTSSLCKRNDAIEMIRQQIDLTKTFDNTLRRITVLNRAADLLWPFQQDKARAAFTEAFEVAAQNEKEKSESKDRPRALIFSMQIPDQRYVVIRAVAKRDAAWAKKLTEQMLKLERQNGEQSSTKDSFNDVLTAYRLLDSANQMLSTDINVAIDLARASLNYPATAEISRFLYKLAELNQQAADQFYDQALVVYADRPMREFLYLSAFPFAFSESGSTPVFASYVVPANFVTNNSLQRRFVQTLLRRAQQALEVPLDEGDNFNLSTGPKVPGPGHILQVLVRIEPQVRERLPDLSEAVVQAREKILVSLSPETQKTLGPDPNDVSSPPEKTFDERIETAAKAPNVNKRDDLIATAVLSAASDKESLAAVVDAIDKITESSIRAPLLEWLYFRRAKEAANGKRFDEAERLASKVEGREQRAYLHTEIARGLLNTSETQTQAREVLDEAITEANKAGTTIFAARTLLTASNLYAKIDLGRSISILGDAINCINHIEAPDFSVGDQTLVKEVKRLPFRRLLRFHMPGLDPEKAFREMAKIDFDDALSQTSAFTDKFQRAITILALADVCLQQAQPTKAKPKKIAKP